MVVRDPVLPFDYFFDSLLLHKFSLRKHSIEEDGEVWVYGQGFED